MQFTPLQSPLIRISFDRGIPKWQTVVQVRSHELGHEANTILTGEGAMENRKRKENPHKFTIYNRVTTPCTGGSLSEGPTRTTGRGSTWMMGMRVAELKKWGRSNRFLGAVRKFATVDRR